MEEFEKEILIEMTENYKRKDISMGKGFDYAVQQLKLGKRMKREGWNGKDQYIDLVSNVSFIDPDGVIHNVDHFDMGNKAIAFHGTSGIQLGWLATQSDILSEDWVTVEESSC